MDWLGQIDISQCTMERKKNYGGLLRSIAMAILAAAAMPGAAVDNPWPQALRGQIARLNDVGYHIGVIAAPLCRSTAAGTGIALDYLGAYDVQDRPAISALLRMSDLPQIAAVARGSPGEAAGIKPGDDLIEINGTPIAQLRSASVDTALFADELEQRLAATLKGQRISLRLRRDGSTLAVDVMPRAICSARFVIKTGAGMSAFSDGANVAISNRLVEFTENDDELALIVGHETGHIINRDGKADGLQERRQMEDRADIMGVRLASCAGYDAEKAFRFWLRRDAKDLLRFLRSPTHRSRKSRVELMRKENGVLSCPPAAAIRLQRSDS